MGKTFESLITLTQVADGAVGPAADQYRIETNQEEILICNEDGNITFSPNILKFWLEKEGEIIHSEIEEFYIISPLYKKNNYNLVQYENILPIIPDTTDTRIHTLNVNEIINISERLNRINNNETTEDDLFVKVTGLSETDFTNGEYFIKPENSEYYERAITFSENTDYYKITNQNAYDYYYNTAITFKERETVFRIKLKNNEQGVAYKILSCRFGSSEDMAKFSLHANEITASIQDAGLEFNSEGLTINNAGFKIVKQSKNPISYNPVSFLNGEGYEPDKYYIYNEENGTYEKSTESYDENKQYYEAEYDNKVVFNANSENGNVMMCGDIYAENGIFNGTINAKEGQISGLLTITTNNEEIEIGTEKKYVQATSFIKDETYYTLVNDQYIETDEVNENNFTDYYILEEKSGIFSSNYSENKAKGFYIKTSGEIYANNIYIGASAQISDYLRLGGNTSYSYLQNPDKYNGIFLAVREKEIDPNNNNNNNYIISLSNTGILKLGNLSLNGEYSSIQTSTYSSGISGWRIDDNKAEFNNVTLRGKIESSVMSYGDVQTIGGILIVRPSTIFRVEEDKYYLDNSNGFFAGDKCSIGESGEENIKYYTIKTLSTSDNSITFEEEIDSKLDGKIITSYGQIKYKKTYVEVPSKEVNATNFVEYYIKNGNNYIKADSYDSTQVYYNEIKTSEIDKNNSTNIGIGLNASSHASSCAPNAISIFEFNPDNNTRTNRIVLGKMAGQSEYGGLTGYGLYADNVYLKGSLISSSDADSKNPFYSGINTSSGVDMPDVYFPEKQIGKILFWAGATDVNSIKDSPFKVDSYGNLYAGSGYFEGSVITKATITAAKMRTAVLEGWNVNSEKENKEAALTIKNVDNAIEFKDSSDSKFMTISKTGGFVLDLQATFNKEINANGGIAVDGENSIAINNVYLTESEGLKIEHGDAEIATFSKQAINFKEPTIHTYSIFSQNSEVEIRWALNKADQIVGYDLYIKE